MNFDGINQLQKHTTTSIQQRLLKPFSLILARASLLYAGMDTINFSSLFMPSAILILRLEGDYVNYAADHGGEARFSISKANYPYLDIAKLTVEDAKKIGHTDCWQHCRCDDLPPPLTIFVFDAAINHGVSGADTGEYCGCDL